MTLAWQSTLVRRLARLAKSARGKRRSCLSVTIAVPPIDPLSSLQAFADEDRVFFESSAGDLTLLGIGAAERFSDDGDGPEGSWRRTLSEALVDTDPAHPMAAPVAVGGFAFDADRLRDDEWRAFGRGALTLPRLLLTRRQGSCWLTVNVAKPAGAASDRWLEESEASVQQSLRSLRAPERLPGSDDDRSLRSSPLEGSLDTPEARVEWNAAVETILDEVRQGRVEKQVLARRVRLGTSRAPGIGAVLGRLRSRFGDACTLFAFTRGPDCFLGASPERLVRVHGRRVHADGLAGSTARGRSPAEDHALAAELLASEKERREHGLVVSALREGLTPLCDRLDVGDRPGILSMANVQHLHTPVTGELRGETSIVSLVRRLHPTPASGGHPRSAVLSRIRACESFDRGWYAGPVGWVDAGGGGEFVVAIRSALIRRAPQRDEILLYAGCGIVEGSDPDAEFRESCLKLDALRWALDRAYEIPARTEVPWSGDELRTIE